MHENSEVHSLMQFFYYAQLPEKYQETGRRFYLLAKFIDNNLPKNAEKTTALRKLMESRDAAFRAVIMGRQNKF